MNARADNRPDAVALRKRQLAAVHIARAQLGMDEDTYRALVRRVSAATGNEVASAGQLQPGQMRAFLDELRRLGAPRPRARASASYPGKPHNFDDGHAMPGMITKIEAQLADMGLSWAYADAIAKRQCGLARIAWVREPAQLKAIIAALDVEQTKRAGNEFIDAATQRLGMGEKQLAELAAGFPKNWRRKRVYLKQAAMHLQARLDMLEQKESEA